MAIVPCSSDFRGRRPDRRCCVRRRCLRLLQDRSRFFGWLLLGGLLLLGILYIFLLLYLDGIFVIGLG